MGSETPSPPYRDDRRAAAARRYLDGDLTYGEFIDLGFIDSSDRDIEMMCDIIVHEPPRRGFLSPTHVAFQAQVMEFVDRLEAD